MNGHFWTLEERKQLKKHYSNHTAKQCARKLGRTVPAIYGRVHEDHLKHSKTFQNKLQKMFCRNLTKAGKPYRIKLGGILPNGKRAINPKGVHYSPDTEFKKGNQPAGTLYDGAIRTRIEKTGHCGNKRLMKFIRIKKRKWVYLKNYIWEKHHGKVPKGMLVAFKNPKDQMNCSLRNLCLITKAESARRTQEMDEYIAQLLSHPKRKPLGSFDRELYEEILKHPEILDLKRKEMQLRRKLKAHGKAHRK